MPAIPYPTASYPNDPLEIPIDTMTSIEMEIYNPGLIHHQADSGDQFFLKRGTPRWRGNVRWAACYTNSERAGAIEGYLASLSEGLLISTLKHGREVVEANIIRKRGTGIGLGAVDVTSPVGPNIEDISAGPSVYGMSYLDGRMFFDFSTTPGDWYQMETWTESNNGLGSVISGGPISTRSTIEANGHGGRNYLSFITTANAQWIRIRRIVDNNEVPVEGDMGQWGRFARIPRTGHVGSVPVAVTYLRANVFSPPKAGQLFKPAAGRYTNRIFMVSSVNGGNLTFTPDINIFAHPTDIAGSDLSSVGLDQTSANQFLRVRATPGRTISLPRGGTLSGPWNMSWIEGV